MLSTFLRKKRSISWIVEKHQQPTLMRSVLKESSLSFLGFGVPPYVASWGALLSQSRDFMDIAWWLTLAPGFAIFITITAYNLVGEGLRDAIDPRLRI